MKKKTSRKCCFCLPLRKSLLCIGYIRLIICLLSIVQYSLICVAMFRRMQDSYADAVTFLQSVFSIIPQLLDLIFTQIFIVAAHKKKLKLLEVFYFYCITLILVYSLIVILTVFDSERFNIMFYMMFPHAVYIEYHFYEFLGFGITILVLQLYITLLVKSEVNYLKECTRAELARQRSFTSFRLPKLNLT